jgi:hypothetical protein
MLHTFHGISLLNHKRVTDYKENIQRTIAKMQEGLPGCNVEKLQGSSLWSARFNEEERMIFTYMLWNGKTYLFVLDYLAHHDYHRSDILKNPAVLAHCKQKLATLFSHADSPEQLASAAEVSAEKTPSQVSTITLTSFGKDTWVQLSLEQEKALNFEQFPLLVTGVAGSGKTCVAFALLSDQLDKLSAQLDEKALENPETTRPLLSKLLYLTRYPHLAQDMQRRWQERPMPEGYVDAVQFMTVEEFLEKQTRLTQKPEPTQEDKQKFTDWYNQFFEVSRSKKHARQAKQKASSPVKKAAEKLKVLEAGSSTNHHARHLSQRHDYHS